MSDIRFKTIGTTFVEQISSAKNSDELFGTLQEYCCITGDMQSLQQDLAKIDLPEKKETATFRAAVYKIQIEQRNKIINQKICTMQNKEQIRGYLLKYLSREKKLPKITDYTIIAMGAFLQKGFGRPQEFKRELYQYFGLDQPQQKFQMQHKPEINDKNYQIGFQKAMEQRRLRA